MLCAVHPSLPLYTTSLSYLLELLIVAVLENEYDSVTRAMFLRSAAMLQIPYFLFLSYEERLIVNLRMVAERLSKDNASLEKSTSRVSVISVAIRYTQKKGKWLKIITTGAIAGTCAALSGCFDSLSSFSSPSSSPRSCSRHRHSDRLLLPHRRKRLRSRRGKRPHRHFRLSLLLRGRRPHHHRLVGGWFVVWRVVRIGGDTG